MAKFLFALKVWGFVWPMVTMMIGGMRLLSLQLPLLVQTMIISGTLVPLMVYCIIPWLRNNAARTSPEEQ